MPQATLLLSELGLHTLGREVFLLAAPEERGVSGMLVAYDAQGIWFQDPRLQRENKVVLVKWNFIDAILSDVPPLGPAGKRPIGFQL